MKPPILGGLKAVIIKFVPQSTIINPQTLTDNNSKMETSLNAAACNGIYRTSANTNVQAEANNALNIKAFKCVTHIGAEE